MRIILSVFFLGLAFFGVGQGTQVKKNLVINKSVKFKKGIYKLNATTQLNEPLIRITGNNIVVDFNNSIIIGSNDKLAPDDFYGLCIQINHGKNITIRNLQCKGYKIGIMADSIEGLTFENCDLSFNYRQHLSSTQQKEDISDWLSHHHNEHNEWMRYGAGIYMLDCSGFKIYDCIVTHGQNGVMLTRCVNGEIYNNNFSFNSGLGIALYRSSNNKILYNKLDFNVRGYSDGVYARGQDSGGLLVYEQSNDNLFYKNSVTHSGDGFFLWAGQTTMDNGSGGCNNNLIADNDFSYAPTNGIEVTFSSNKIIHNRIFECENGIWGGYSYNTDISDNQFRKNKTAIAIEHGQNNIIHQNLFIGDKVAIHLWGNKEEPSDWGYPKFRDTRSRNYVFIANSFNNNPIAYHISHTDSIAVYGDRFSDVGVSFKIDSTVTRLDSTINDSLWTALSEQTPISYPEIKNASDPFKGVGHLQGRKNILITEWGPYDFEYPLLWNTNPVDSSDTLHFNVYGPKGKWKVVSVKGLQLISAKSGSIPSSLTGIKAKTETKDIAITLEYTGSSFKDEFGKVHTKDKPYHFGFHQYFKPVEFDVKWFITDSTANNQKRLIKQEVKNRLDYTFWNSIDVSGKKYKNVFMIAEGHSVFEEGNYDLNITYNDKVRIYIDDKLVVNENPVMNSQYDDALKLHKIVHLAGMHRLRVEHELNNDFDALSLKIQKVVSLNQH